MQAQSMVADAIIVSVVPPLEETSWKASTLTSTVLWRLCTAFEAPVVVGSCRYIPNKREHGQSNRYSGSTVTGLIENWCAQSP
jgi:hypothetical protein